MAEIRNYIVGYGSLRDPESRARTGVTGPAYTIAVQGYAASFNVRVAPNWTALGSAHLEGSVMDAVAVEVSEQELPKFDERESPEYERKELPRGAILSQLGQALPEGSVLWMYIPLDPHEANEEYPLYQSYVDVVLNGCRRSARDGQTGEEAMMSFVASTTGWHNLVDDRANPIYSRALDYNNPECASFSSIVDRILQEIQPEAYKRRTIVKRK